MLHPQGLVPEGNEVLEVLSRMFTDVAGDWTNTDAVRLQSIVDRAHELGYLVRVYTLNGHPEDEHPERRSPADPRVSTNVTTSSRFSSKSRMNAAK